MAKPDDVHHGAKHERHMGVLWALAVSALIWALVAAAVLHKLPLIHG